MNKKYYTKFNIKDKTLRRELARAHGMILLLVVALMGMLAFSSQFDLTLDPILTIIAVLLLAIVGIISLSVIITLTRKPASGKK